MPNSKLLFMIKADAYGHGIINITKYAHEECQVEEFGCATLGEALRLRKNLSDLEIEVYVFSDTDLASQISRREYIDKRILPVISSLDDLEMVLDDKEMLHLPLVLKFNTGMNRLGIKVENKDNVLRLLKKHQRQKIHHLMTHFASSFRSQEVTASIAKQAQAFNELKNFFLNSGLKIEKTSLSNSGAIEQQLGGDETHIRPGLMLYGPSSMLPKTKLKTSWKGLNISNLEVGIIRKDRINKGEPIGYGETPAPKDGVLVYVAIGYGDGFLTQYSGFVCQHKGHHGSVVGRISMDLTAILFPLKAEADLKVGECISLWSEDCSAIIDLCKISKSIPYQVFTALNERVPRVYQWN